MKETLDLFRRTIIASAALVLLGLTPAAFAQNAEPEESAEAENVATEQTFEKQYASLMVNNLFVRDRKPPPVAAPPRESTPPPPAPPPPPPEKEWVLTGIVFEEGQFRAYFENVKNGQVLRVAPGEGIANGFIGEVFIDSVAFIREGETVWVDFGKDLTGATAIRTAGSTASASTTKSSGDKSNSSGEAGEGDSGADGDDNLSLIERMRRRRQQEADG